MLHIFDVDAYMYKDKTKTALFAKVSSLRIGQYCLFLYC